MDDIINKVCKHLPCDYEIILRIENGATWLEMYNGDYKNIELGDPADKTITEQLNDALCIANGFGG